MCSVPCTPSSVPLPLQEDKLRELVRNAKDWAIMHGACMRSRSNFSEDTINFAPFTLFPTTFPREQFQKAVDIQTVFLELIHKVAHDGAFLRECLKDTIKVDDFTANLFRIYETIEKEGRAQPIELELMRSDYMLDSTCDRKYHSDYPPCDWKQVEYNTIAAGFYWLGPVSGDIHRYVFQELGYDEQLKNLPENSALAGLSESLIEAWRLYGNPEGAILFVVEKVSYNICDQRFPEFKIRELNPQVKVIRRTIDELGERARLNQNGELVIDNLLINVIYYRIGYEPASYPTQKQWDTRLLLERIPGELNFPHKTELNDLSKTRRRRWISAIKREDLTETKLKYSRVCEKHFLNGKPADLSDDKNPDWVPSLYMGYGNDERIKKRLDSGTARLERAEKRRKIIHEDIPENIVEAEVPITETAGEVANEKLTQTELTADDLSTIMLSLESTKKLQARLEKLDMGINFLKGNDIKTKYYTGLNSFIKFEGVFHLLKDYIIVHHNSSLPVFEQILLTFMKLRLNLDFKDLAYRFGVSPTTASTYFKNVIEIMFLRFEKLILWPSREILIKSMPKCFSQTFGDKITVIIDCFEIFTEKPSNLLKAAQCWSNYKHHHTIKYLIGITPAGTISFISEAWGGRASDKHITLNSKFLDNIIRGDVILADRGFLISDQVRLLHAELQMPAFTKGKKQLHPVEIETTRSIAHVRIHVERIIGCIRQKYRILSDNMPISLLSSGEDSPILDKIVVVCCALINLCPPIVPSY